VLEHVLSDLGDLAENAGRRIARAAAKSGRFVGEMHAGSDLEDTLGVL
jgi:hypothetical protein